MSKIKILFSLIIIYPFFYIVSIFNNSFDASFANIYYLFVLSFIFLLWLYKPKLRISNFINFIILLLLILITISNFSSLKYIKPFVFFIFFLFIYIFLNTKKIKVVNFINFFSYKFSMYAIIVISFVMILINYGYTDLGRFKSFLISPTLFCVFLDVLFIFFLVSNKKKNYILILYAIMIYLHIKSGTRLNLLFIIFIPIIYFIIKNKTNLMKVIIIFLYIISLNFIYPLYQYYTESSSNNLMSARYEDGRDASFGLRLSLFNLGFKTLMSGENKEILFGRGSEYARALIVKTYHQDLLLHNDFIRFSIDFGIVALLLYMILLIRLSLVNNLSYLLVMLYLLTFYHNMIYSYYLIALIVISAFIKIDRRF